MRRLAIAALMAGLAVTTGPAAAQTWGDWGYAGWGARSGFGVSVGFGSPGYYGAYAAAPGYAYAAGPGCACPGSAGFGYARPYAYGGYAYAPGYAYGGYAYAPGYDYGASFGYRTYGGPNVAVGVREGVRSRSVVRERGVVRVGSRDDTVIRRGVRERGAIRSQRQVRGDVTTGSTIRSRAIASERSSGMRVRGSARADADTTVGRGGELRGEGRTRRGGGELQMR